MTESSRDADVLVLGPEDVIVWGIVNVDTGLWLTEFFATKKAAIAELEGGDERIVRVRLTINPLKKTVKL